MWTYTVVDKTKDLTNGNIVVNVNFVDDTNPGVVYSRQTFAFDLTNDSIDNWAHNVIAILVARDTNFDSITTGQVVLPKPVDPTVQATKDAQVALSQALQAAQLKAQIATLAANDPDVQTAYDNLLNAQAAVAIKLPASPVKTVKLN